MLMAWSVWNDGAGAEPQNQSGQTLIRPLKLDAAMRPLAKSDWRTLFEARHLPDYFTFSSQISSSSISSFS
jgi:hypothetical protein